MNRINIDNWKNVVGLNLGGARDKIVVEDPETGLLCVAKFRLAIYDSCKARDIARRSGIKNVGVFDLHEYLAYMINNEIGIPSARVRLGIHNGSKCAITDYFYNKDKGEVPIYLLVAPNQKNTILSVHIIHEQMELKTLLTSFLR